MTGKFLRPLVAASLLIGLGACGPTLAQKKDQSSIHYRLGVVHLNERNVADALKELTKSIEIYPDDPSYHNALGLAYLARGMHKPEAIEEARAALKNIFYRTPEDAWFNMGTSYYNMGDHQKALESYNKAVGVKPADARSWYSMGLAYEKMNKTREAVQSYEKAVAVFPGYLDAYFNMGMALVKTKDKAAAVKAFEKVIELAPSSPKAQSAREYIGLIK